MARQMRTSDKGVELIKSFEGFRARASRLPDGKWLVGYGHTETARAGLTVSAFDAELILRFHDLKRVENHLAQQVFTPLSQNEFDALVSFAFNIGLKAFDSSDVLAHLNSGDRILAAEAMSSWRRGRVDGQIRVIDGLVRRRAVEVGQTGIGTLPSCWSRDLNRTALAPQPSARARQRPPPAQWPSA